MTARIYSFPGAESRAHTKERRDEASEDSGPELKTIAQELKRASIIRTCEIIERNNPHQGNQE